MRSGSTILALLTLLLAVLTGIWIQRDSGGNEHAEKKPLPEKKPMVLNQLSENKSLTRKQRHNPGRDDAEELPPFAKENERIATFDDDEAYRKFLADMERHGLKLLGKSDRMRAVRFGFGHGFDPSELEDADLAYNYVVTIPPPPDAAAQPGAVGFGRNALSWLGVTGDNSQWGKGVTVAVLDSGVTDHIALNQGNGKVRQIELTEIDGAEQLGHGTAVASIISGDHPLTPGVAPAADILSIRVTDESGSSDSFTLAEGIFEAVDAGAKVINISMGSYGDSGLVRRAVEHAQQNGAVIVASSGNAGLDAIAYPAAYPDVIAVGAVEAGGEHLDFSNTGENLSVAAPGLGVNAAWGTEQLTSFSGTSASAPFISGAIAAAMSEKNLTAQVAAGQVTQNANEAGFPGSDVEYGNGILDISRVMNVGTPGIYDAAIASQVLIPPSAASGLPQVLVTVQNRGTETLINSPLTINGPSGKQTVNISSLAPGAIQTYPIPVVFPGTNNPVTISSTVQTTERDTKSSNNSKSDEFIAPEAP